MDRANHYERAFAAYVRWRGRLVLGVDEARRGELDGEPIKSPDFLVVGGDAPRLAVDVKGRRYPAGPPDRRRYVWESWATRADVDGLGRWADLLGAGYAGVLVFVYHVLPEVRLPDETDDLWSHHDRTYLFRAVEVADYRQRMRPRSPRWGTVDLPRREYRELVQPLSAYLGEPDEAEGNAHERECWTAP